MNTINSNRCFRCFKFLCFIFIYNAGVQCFTSVLFKTGIVVADAVRYEPQSNTMRSTCSEDAPASLTFLNLPTSGIVSGAIGDPITIDVEARDQNPLQIPVVHMIGVSFIIFNTFSTMPPDSLHVCPTTMLTLFMHVSRYPHRTPPLNNCPRTKLCWRNEVCWWKFIPQKPNPAATNADATRWAAI